MGSKSEILCPDCGSEEVSSAKVPAKYLALAILLIGFPLPFLPKERYCFDCGLNFSNKDIK